MGSRVQQRNSERIVPISRTAAWQNGNAGAVFSEVELEARRLRNEALGKAIEKAFRATTGVVRRAWVRVNDYLERRGQYRELARLDAHQLRDIGLSPGDLAAVADGSFFDDPTRRQRYLAEPAATPATPNWTERGQPGIRTVTLPPHPDAPLPRTGSDG